MNAQNYVIPTLFPSSSSSSLHKIAKNPQPPQPLRSKEPSSSNAYLKFTDVNINEEEDLGHQCIDSQRMTIAFKHKNSGRVAQAIPQDQFRKKEMSATPSQPTSRLSREENQSSRQSDYTKGYTKQMGPHYQQKKITGKPLMVMQQKNFMLPKSSVQYGSLKPKSKVKKGSRKQFNEPSFNKKPKYKNMGQPHILGLSSKEPSYKMSILANAEGSSFHEKRFSEGPSISGKEDDHSTPEMIGDDSETQIKQESDSEFGTSDQVVMNPPYAALKHTNLSIIKKKSINEVNKLKPRGPVKKNKGSFANTDNFPDELQLTSIDRQKYMSVRKQKNENYININQNFQVEPSNVEGLSPIFQHKLEKLNQSNGDQSPHIVPFLLVNPSEELKQKGEETKKRIEIQIHQDYTIQGPLTKNIKQKSPSFKSNQPIMVNQIHTPTGASKQQFASPKVLSNKSASQTDLRESTREDKYAKRMFSVDKAASEQYQSNKQRLLPSQNTNQIKFKIIKDSKQQSPKKKPNFISRQEKKIKERQHISNSKEETSPNQEVTIKINNAPVPPFKLKHTAYKYAQPHMAKPDNNKINQNRSADKSYLVKNDADESIPVMLGLSKQSSEQHNQISIMSKLQNFFRKGTLGNLKASMEEVPHLEVTPIPIGQEVVSTTNTRSKNMANDIYTDLFSPIMEEKFIHKGTEMSEEEQVGHTKNRADYFSKENSISSKFTCECMRKESVPFACQTALNWLQILEISNEADLKKMKELYFNLIGCPELKNYEDQIEKDLARTFPKCEQFQQKEGQLALKRVLLAFSRYDLTLGYVQGMNFIVGSLLYHCSEEVAFWIFVTLVEQFEIRDIFEPGLPGLYKHSYILDRLIEIHIPDLHRHFVTLNYSLIQKTHSIFVEMYASDWIFCLFSNIIPLDLLSDFYDSFFDEGWIYFYKFALSMLGAFKEKLLEEDEFAGILSHIKFKTPEKGSSQEQHLSSQEKSPHSMNKVFIIDENTNTIQKQTVQPTTTLKGQSRLEKMFGFLVKKQEAVWTRIFNMAFSWKVTEEQIKGIAQEYKTKFPQVQKRESGLTPRFVIKEKKNENQ